MKRKTTTTAKVRGMKALSKKAKAQPAYAKLSDLKLLDKVIVYLSMPYKSHIYSSSVVSASQTKVQCPYSQTTTGVVLGKNTARGVLLGFEKSSDIGYPDSFADYQGYEVIVEDAIRESCFEKQVWFDLSNVMEVSGVYDLQLKVKKLSETPYILAENIRVGDTICFAENDKTLFMNVYEVEEGEINGAPSVSLRGTCHKPSRSFIVLLPQYNIKRDTKVILIDRDGEE